jgi:hypothetical protein
MLKRIALLLGICGVCGCEAWLEVDDPQCKSNQDCVGLFGREYTCNARGVCLAPSSPDAGGSSGPSKPLLPARWACVNEAPRDFVPDPDRTVTMRMDVVDVTTLRVPPALVAEACHPRDIECADPIANDLHPGADGFLEFVVPYGFEGFMGFTAPDFVPALLFSNRALIEDVTTSGPALSTITSLDDFASHSGRDIGAGTGLAIIEIRDCSDKAGDGVKFDPIGDETPFYFDGALPARGLSATTVSNLLGAGRESRAVGGFSNLSPGYATIQARIATNDVVVGRVTVQIRAGYITYVRLYAGS